MKITGIYGIRHKTTDRWYVGQAYDIRKRFKDHRAMASTKTRKHLYLSLRKYGYTAFAWRILERCEKAELNRREKFWVQKLNAVEPNGFNLTTGGDRGYEFTSSVLEKMRKASLGRVQSTETIRKRVEKNIGQRRTLATRRKMRKAQLGKKASETTRRKLARIRKRISRLPKMLQWNRERMLKLWRNREFRRRQKIAHQGYKPLESTRRKLSRRSKERWKNLEYRAKIISHSLGRRHSKAAKRRISVGNKGKKRTERWKIEQSSRVKKIWLKGDYRQRVIKALTGRKQSKALIARRIVKLIGRRKYSIQDMQKWAGKKGGRCISRKYDGAHHHLKWRCKRRHTWLAQPTNIMFGKWCPLCRNEELSARFRTKNAIQKYRQIARKRGGVLLTRKAPRNQREHLQWRCRNGHIFLSKANNVLNGKWCKRCALAKRGLKLIDLSLN
ncbi:MAG: hypothetical protein F2923_00275 [Actinobacteria bacterium]|uniref:Unannotated protein n=1 Tax=freshwater metagenome TaxID=449393 RepID=A0A6J7RWF7_9ZZZZ|nr:hypothetical protein [Actinomycetota bacterium]